MALTKEEFYALRARSYPIDDPEALIRYQRVLRWMTLSPTITVRELGCKYAVLRDILKEKLPRFDYQGVDIDEATLRKIPDYNDHDFIVHNINNGFPFKDKSIDYLVCLEILEHLDNGTFFFSEAKRCLKDDGKLILSVPNPYCWMEANLNFREGDDTEGHIATYTQQNIKALTKFCGMHLYASQGSFTRIPFSRRLMGKFLLVETDNLFLSRNRIFLIVN